MVVLFLHEGTRPLFRKQTFYLNFMKSPVKNFSLCSSSTFNPPELCHSIKFALFLAEFSTPLNYYIIFAIKYLLSVKII
jgi:hypothetical protein